MLNEENQFNNNNYVYKSNLVRYISIIIGYLTVAIWCTLTTLNIGVLRTVALPFNIVVVYLIMQKKEMSRGAKYIKMKYPDLWKEISAHAIGDYIEPSWISKKDESIDDEILMKIKKNLREFRIITLVTILYMPIFVLIISYLT